MLLAISSTEYQNGMKSKDDLLHPGSLTGSSSPFTWCSLFCQIWIVLKVTGFFWFCFFFNKISVSAIE